MTNEVQLTDLPEGNRSINAYIYGVQEGIGKRLTLRAAAYKGVGNGVGDLITVPAGRAANHVLSFDSQNRVVSGFLKPIQITGATATKDQILTTTGTGGTMSWDKLNINNINATGASASRLLSISSSGTGLAWVDPPSVSLGANSVNTSNIVDKAVTSSKLAVNAVVRTNIAANAVGSQEIATGSIKSTHLASGAIKTDAFADSQITPDKIDTTNNVSNYAVLFADVNHDFSWGKIVSNNISNNAITTATINANAVTQAKLADSAVSLDQLDAADKAANKLLSINNAGTGLEFVNAPSSTPGNNSITTAKIVNSAVTTAKLAASAVTEAKLSNNSVSITKLKLPNAGSSGQLLGTTGSGFQWVNAPSAVVADGSITHAKLGTDIIEEDNIKDDAVDYEHINATGQGANKILSMNSSNNALVWVTASQASIGSGAVTTDKLAANAVTGAKIANLTITSGKVADNAVITSKINDRAVTKDKLGNTSVAIPQMDIVGTKAAGKFLKVNASDTNKLEYTDITVTTPNNSIDTVHLVDDAVTTGKINDIAITTAKIANANVTGAKIANATITGGKLVVGTITSTLLADSSVTLPKLSVSGTAASGKILKVNANATGLMFSDDLSGGVLADGSILASKLASNSVTKAKVADDAIGEAELDTTNTASNGQVLSKSASGLTWVNQSSGGGGGSLTDGSVTTVKIADDAVTNAKMADDSVDSDQIVDGAIDTSHIGDGQITFAKLDSDIGNQLNVPAFHGTTLTNYTIDTSLSNGVSAGSIYRTNSNRTIYIRAKTADVNAVNSITNIGFRIKIQKDASNYFEGVVIGKTTYQTNIPVITLRQSDFKSSGTISDTDSVSIIAENAIFTEADTIGNVNIKDGAVTDRKIANNSLDGTDVFSIKDTLELSKSGVTSSTLLTANSFYRVSNNRMLVGLSNDRNDIEYYKRIFATGNRIVLSIAGTTDLDSVISSSNIAFTNNVVRATLTFSSNFINIPVSGPAYKLEVKNGIVKFNGSNSSINLDGSVKTTNTGSNGQALTKSSGGLTWATITSTPANNSITTAMLQNSAVTSAKLASGSALANIGSGGVTQTYLASNSVGSAQMRDDAVGINELNISGTQGSGKYIRVNSSNNGLEYISAPTFSIANNTITTAMLQNNAVTTAKINADAVTGSKIADDAIDSEHYKDGSIDADHISNGAITADKLASNSVTTVKVNNGAITSDKLSASGKSNNRVLIADSTQTSGQRWGLIGDAELVSNAVSTAKVQNGAITEVKLGISNTGSTNQFLQKTSSGMQWATPTVSLGSNSVNTTNIVNGAVTKAKLASNSVDSDQYVDGSIDRVHLSADIIDSSKLADNSVNSEHYVDGSIDHEHLAANVIEGDNIKTSNSGSSGQVLSKGSGNTLTWVNQSSGGGGSGSSEQISYYYQKDNDGWITQDINQNTGVYFFNESYFDSAPLQVKNTTDLIKINMSLSPRFNKSGENGTYYHLSCYWQYSYSDTKNGTYSDWMSFPGKPYKILSYGYYRGTPEDVNSFEAIPVSAINSDSLSLTNKWVKIRPVFTTGASSLSTIRILSGIINTQIMIYIKDSTLSLVPNTQQSYYFSGNWATPSQSSISRYRTSYSLHGLSLKGLGNNNTKTTALGVNKVAFSDSNQGNPPAAYADSVYTNDSSLYRRAIVRTFSPSSSALYKLNSSNNWEQVSTISQDANYLHNYDIVRSDRWYVLDNTSRNKPSLTPSLDNIPVFSRVIGNRQYIIYVVAGNMAVSYRSATESS